MVRGGRRRRRSPHQVRGDRLNLVLGHQRRGHHLRGAHRRRRGGGGRGRGGRRIRCETGLCSPALVRRMHRKENLSGYRGLRVSTCRRRKLAFVFSSPDRRATVVCRKRVENRIPSRAHSTSATQKLIVTHTNTNDLATCHLCLASSVCLPICLSAGVVAPVLPTETTMEGLTNGLVYSFQVVAVNAFGNSARSLPSNKVGVTGQGWRGRGGVRA